MADYLARVELHDAEEEEDYEKLDEAMEKRGFVQTIQADDGTAYQLPDTTYVVQNSNMTATAAHDAAVAAAQETGFEFGLIVVEFASSEWTNLEAV